MSSSAKSCFVTVAVVVAGFCQADVLVNQDPSTGPYGGAWLNQTHQQIFADSFTLSQGASVTGFDIYATSNQPTLQWEFNLWSDSGSNTPGAAIQTLTLTPTSYIFWGVHGVSTWTVAFDFAPISVSAGTKYWVGASGIGADPGMPSTQPSSNGDSFLATRQFDGAWDFNNQIGDLTYRLRGTSVPEPATFVALALGAVALLRRRRSGGC